VTAEFFEKPGGHNDFSGSQAASADAEAHLAWRMRKGSSAKTRGWVYLKELST
jgi:hypothetical protein